MALSASEVLDLARQLDQAQRQRTLVARLTETNPSIDVADGYRIQRELQRLKQTRGARLVGYKMGLTSPAKMKQIGLSSPVFGFLTDDLRCADGGDIDISSLVQPRVEPEIAFITGRELSGGNCTVEAALAATAFIAPALEILDSRFAGFKFDLASAIADNTSAARFVVAERRIPVASLDLAALGVSVEKNGDALVHGSSDNVLGHPARSLAMLADMLAAEGSTLPAGAIVLSGGITEAISVSRGDSISVHIESVGRVSVNFR